jgi:MFS family permease
VDSTALNVALPAIGRDLGGGLAAQQWITNSYLLTLSAFILLAGSLADRVGARWISFGLGSAVLLYAVGWLTATRAFRRPEVS